MEELSSLEKANSFLTIPGFELEEQIRSPEPSHSLFLARRVPTLNNQLPYGARSPTDGTSSPLVFLDFGPAKELEHEKNVLTHLTNFYQQDATWKKYIPVFEDTVMDGQVISVPGSDQRCELKSCEDIKPITTLREFLKIATGATKALMFLHESFIIHNDLTPAHLLFDQLNQKVFLIGYSKSIVVSSTEQRVTLQQSASTLRTNLQYIAPEQTGCVNRHLDFRTDIYGLGATFYALISGKPMFETSKLIDTITSHLAKKPSLLTSPYFDVPDCLREIIEKMVEKDSEERYQTAYGLLMDFKRFKRFYDDSTGARMNITFPLGKHDKPGVFKLSPKLYGREVELEFLYSAYLRKKSGASSNCEFILITGSAGVGKSALVLELSKKIGTDAFFAIGKFEQFRTETPYYAVISACTMLVQRILTTSNLEVQQWKELISTAVYPNGQLLIDLIPSLASIIGPQRRVTELSPLESQKRILEVLTGVLLAFTSKKPLILFLDDLQWSDCATLKLLEYLFTTFGKDDRKLLILGAYRDDEVSIDHPLIACLNHIAAKGGEVNKIHLEPLSLNNVNRFLGDSINIENYDQCRDLAAVVHLKTGGLPFFINQFLKSLYSQQFLRYNQITGSWQWDIQMILQDSSFDNEMMLLLSKIKRMKPHTVEILRTASFLGSSFDAKLLCLVLGKTEAELENDLLEALQEELLVPKKPAHLKFMHDRIQQAAYLTIDDKQRIAEHIKIGRILLQAMKNDSSLEYSLFDVVTHLNYGIDQMTSIKDIVELTELNVVVAQKAKQSSAFAIALTYLNASESLIRKLDRPWDQIYDTTFVLYYELAESYYFASNPTKAEELFGLLDAHVKDEMKFAKVTILKLKMYETIGRFREGLEAGKACLQQFGISIDPDTEKLKVMVDFINERIETLPMEAFLEFPDPDARTFVIFELLASLSTISFFASRDVMVMVKTTSCYLHIMNHVKSKFAPIAFCFFGPLLVERGQPDYKNAVKWGEMGFKLANSMRLGGEYFPMVSFLYYSAVSHYRAPYRDIRKGLRSTYEKLAASCQITHACYCSGMYIISGLFSGERLDTVLKDLPTHLKYVKQHGNAEVETTHKGVKRLVEELLGNPNEETQQDFEATLASRTRVTKAFHYMFQSFVHYVMGDYKESLVTMKTAEPFLPQPSSLITCQEYFFIKSIILCANLIEGNFSSEDRQAQVEEVERHLAILKALSDQFAPNYISKYEIVSGDLARVRGNIQEAMIWYNSAIKSATDGLLYHLVALTYEKFVLLFSSMNLLPAASSYFAEAVKAYSQWGAFGKVKQMYKKWPQFTRHEITCKGLSRIDRRMKRKSSVDLAEDIGYDLSQMDLTVTGAVLLKTAQALSKEILLENLLMTIIEVVIEYTGATYGAFLLNRENEELSIEVEGTNSQISVKHIPLGDSKNVAVSVINYVARSRESVLIDDVESTSYSNDPHFAQKKSISVICSPVRYNNILKGILYLENNLTAQAFTNQRLHLIESLSSQIAVSIENALLYEASRHYSKVLEEKNKVKDDFLANTSHELRTPLFGIIGMTEMLEKTQLNEEQQEFVNIISICGRELLIHVDNILDFMKLQEKKIVVKPERFDILECIETCLLALSYRAANRRIEMGYTVSPNIPIHYVGDSLRIKQILLNLLTNAVKFNKDGGEVIVNVEATHQSPDSLQYTLQFSVADKGIGIPTDKWAEIFQPFVQLDPSSHSRSYGGSGLGLCVSQKLCETLNGRVWLSSSEVNQGSMFKFEVPVFVEPRDLKPRLLDVYLMKPTSRAIVCSSFATNRSIMEMHLSSFQIEAVHANNATDIKRELIKGWNSSVEKPISMLVIDEKDLLELEPSFLNQFNLHLFVLCSMTKRLSKNLGSNSPYRNFTIIGKPIQQTKLRDVISRALEKEQQQQQQQQNSIRSSSCSIEVEEGDASEYEETQHPSILITDDNPINVRVLRRFMDKMTKADVDEASNGVEALTLTNKKHYDLILMDVQMPVMGGIEVTQKIRTTEKQVPIIGVTASATMMDREKCLNSGMNDVLTKPFCNEQFRVCLAKWAPHVLR